MSSSGTYHYSIPDDGTQFASTNLADKGPTIALEFVNERVTKGQLAQFKLTASSEIVSEAIVMVDVTDIDDCIQGATPTQTTIEVGQTDGLLEVMTISDQNLPECAVTASLSSNARYKINQSKNSDTIMVVNEIIYTVSIATSDPIDEGQDAIFTITTSPATALELDLNISQSGNYILWNVPRMIRTSTTETDTILTIKTHDDNTDEETGSITVVINASEEEDYRLGFPSEVTLNIMDDDPDNTTQPGNNESRLSIADSAVTTILNVLPTLNPVSRNQLNSPVERSELHASNTIEVEILPTISIVTESPTILEGETARFKLQSDIPVNRNLEVLIEITSNFNIYSGDDLRVVNLQFGQNSTYFNLQTENDDEPEDDGHIQVLIKDGSEYSVAEAPNHSAIVIISDIEGP